MGFGNRLGTIGPGCITRINSTWNRHIYISYYYYGLIRQSLRQKFGDRIRQLRLERRQTQEEFWIDFMKMSVDFGSMVERGITAPSFETIEKICQRLGMTEGELFTFPLAFPKESARGRVKKTAAEVKAKRRRVDRR